MSTGMASRHKLDYLACTARELQSFILSRTGKQAAKRKGKPYYVTFLRRLDKDMTFRFLDLAPELRNLVYLELLTWSGSAVAGERYCWPQILAASKQVNDEAKELLYFENTVCVELGMLESMALGWNTREIRWSMTIGNDKTVKSTGGAPLLRDVRIECPEYLRRVHRIRVNVTGGAVGFVLRDATSNHHSRLVNHVLYALITPLAKANRLKGIFLHFEGDQDVFDGVNVAEIVWPLEKLSLPASSIVLSGLPGDASDWRAQNATDEPALSQTPAFDVWSDGEVVEAQADEYRKLLHKLGAGHHGEVETQALMAMTERQAGLYDLLDNVRLMSQAREDEIRESMHALTHCMREEGPAAFDKAVDTEIERLKAGSRTFREAMEGIGLDAPSRLRAAE
ncbi:hypothetical protein LTR36_003569 [Oleoguttula mirabilis]|uniref:Uncharacterized protein n=1 Tax=Oleoguttula mirabilis TaxID=1507867 RepID=A0AAV9JHX4_9PEZI|nr:hypothetical protein LTR36_003569 [Oleoguttula mirabilis]